MQTHSETLAEFTCGLQPSAIPESVRELARQHLTDSIGVALAGRTCAFAGSALAAISCLGKGEEGTVIGSPLRLPIQNAAWINGIAIHSDDFDDTAFEPTIHPSSVVVPAALAIGEKVDAKADEVLAAMVTGYEILLRLGYVAPGRFLAKGFHATSVCGVFAAAAISAQLLKLSPLQARHALGIAGSMSSGIIEYLGDGSSMKRFHPGWGAMSGITAALLARAGADGPRFVLEGEHGLYRSFLQGDEVNLDRLSQGLGSEWLTREIAFKMYPMCHFIHAFVDCVLDLQHRHMIPLAQIETIECFIAAQQVPIVCEPLEHKKRPRTPYEAKFSLPYNIAAALLDGCVNQTTHLPERISRAEAVDLAARVKYVEDARSLYPRSFSGRVRIRLRDGHSYEIGHAAPIGSASRPPGEDALAAKFLHNADQSGFIRAHELLKRLQTFHGEASLRELLALVT